MKNIKYSFMVLLGGTLYGTMSSFVKKSYADGFTAAELSFWQAFVAAIILTVCTIISAKVGSIHTCITCHHFAYAVHLVQYAA